jgi:hypothetical protein
VEIGKPDMSRVSVTIVAVRAVSLWLIVSGIASGASLFFVRVPAGLAAIKTPPALLFGVLPVVAGLLLWNLAAAIGTRIFPGPAGQSSPHEVDLYRAASAFTGLGLVSWGTLQATSLLAAWIWQIRPGGGLFGETTTPIGAFEFHLGAVHTAVQLGLGSLLLFKPSVAEGLLRISNPPSDPRPTDSGGGD